MADPRQYLEGFTQLHRLRDAEERRATWRQSIATLAAQVEDQRRSVPLEGLSPDALLQGVQVALGARLLDDLDWISAPAAAAALYELAAALPPSEAKRDLGRKVYERLLAGDAATFVALARQLALSSRKALAGPAIRARIALALDLPIGLGTRADALALALISRRELSREWLAVPAMGSLPSRRRAARLLERAAREAAQRAAEGDDSGVRIFETEMVRAPWDRLLGDREGLVWRHVATARGLLSLALPRFDDEIRADLDPRKGPTEWRRAATSLAASIAFQPTVATQTCSDLLASEVFEQDRGVAAALLFGMPRAAEAEPSVVEELLEQLVRCGGLDASEALAELRAEELGDGVGEWASQLARAQLREGIVEGSDADLGRVAIMEALGEELGGKAEAPALRDQLRGALLAFVEEGPAAAFAAASTVLVAAELRIDVLMQAVGEGPVAQKAALRALRELDHALLESNSLSSLLHLDPRANVEAAERSLGDIFERLTSWLLMHEGDPIEVEGPLSDPVMRMTRLRTLIHLVDADDGSVERRTALLRKRRLLTARMLYRRAREDRSARLRRALCAAAARSSDALIREDFAEISDVVILASTHMRSAADGLILSEASMLPEVEAPLRAYAALMASVEGAPGSGRALRASLDALLRLAHELPVATSARVEALRKGLLDFARALEQVAAASSLTELGQTGGGGGLAAFANAVDQLARLVAGTRRRIDELEESESLDSGASIRVLDLCVERALRGNPDDLVEAIQATTSALERELPQAVACVAGFALERLRRLPLDAPRRTYSSFMPAPPKEAPLPAWIPVSRSLGGFHVLRSLGAGAVGSVFVARRAEERHDPTAPQFALKVPDYSGAAARTLSEEQFLHLFREEAGALLALPNHPNIATFVTFDAGVRPKPILVMELVEGPTLERVLEMADLDMERALDVLLGVAAGLAGMHSVGVGHLDVKPSNVILRDAEGSAGVEAWGNAVLVDFGLAGRHLRPGCGTAEYGCPEVWGLASGGDFRSHRVEPADVYSFGCLAYEVLTGQVLFDGDNEIEMITGHLTHDGMPAPIGRLTTDPRTAKLAEILRWTLRRDPAERANMQAVLAALSRVRPDLERLAWPLVA